MVEDSDDRLTPVWRNVVTDLAPTLSQQQRAWLSLTQPVGLLGTTALLAAPTDFAKEAIERILREPITTALSGHLNLQISLAVTVSEEHSVGPLTSSITPSITPVDRQRPSGQRQLDGAEVRAEVAVPGCVDLVDDDRPDLAGELFQRRVVESPEVGGGVDAVQQHAGSTLRRFGR